MNRSEMKNLVVSTLAKHLNQSEQRVTEDADLFEDLGADSLDIVELTLEFEEMFKVDIADGDLEQDLHVSGIIEMLLGKVNSMTNEQNDGPRDPEREDDTAVEDQSVETVENDEDDGEGEADPEADPEED